MTSFNYNFNVNNIVLSGSLEKEYAHKFIKDNIDLYIFTIKARLGDTEAEVNVMSFGKLHEKLCENYLVALNKGRRLCIAGELNIAPKDNSLWIVASKIYLLDRFENTKAAEKRKINFDD